MVLLKAAIENSSAMTFLVNSKDYGMDTMDNKKTVLVAEKLKKQKIGTTQTGRTDFIINSNACYDSCEQPQTSCDA